jgi:hypothetical protein
VRSRQLTRASLTAALTATALLACATGALASGPATPPHIPGSTYCGKIYKADDYTMYTYAKGLGCKSANSFSHACAAKPGLHGWKVTSITSKFGFLLRKGSATIDLEIAGGSPPCLQMAEG